MNINIVRFASVVAASISLCAGEAIAAPIAQKNLPKCDPKTEDCGCSCEAVSVGCIKVSVDLGETTPWTGSMPCALKIMADDDSPSIFTAESLHAVLGGYTFKRLGTQNLDDGITPAEVLFSHPNGESVHFVFQNGESWGRPDPGVHVKMDERLMMVDAEGWAATSDPVYYDLYIGDGTMRRFLATDMGGALGSLVSITDARGVTTMPADMGIDIVYDSNGVRQFLAPSRLADIMLTADFSGYDINVYAISEPPAKDAQTGLYQAPGGQPVEHLSIRRENDGKRAVVTLRKGGGGEQRYVFDYLFNDWSLTRPSGMMERKESYIDDERAAQVVKTDLSSSGSMLAKTVKNYKWESWGFAMTNRVEGFDGLTNITTWTYYTSGNGKGQIKTEKRQSGLLTQYTYDSVDRVISETRSGPDMMTETTAYDYTPVDASDPVLPVDTRSRTVVRKLNNIECERTYYVYSSLTNIVERVGTQGAAFGGTNVLRTVTAFYPIVANDLRSGLVASIRHEDGKFDVYDYSLVSNLWVRTVTHLHEQSLAPVSGKTTRDITTTNARGEILEQKTEAFIDGIWYTIARNRMTYNAEGKRTSLENLAGQITTTAWDCCHKVSETGPDGSTTTWDYDDEGRVIASSRLIPLDMTNVTWLTTCYRYDALGRQIATWQTNLAAQVGLPVTRTRYDQLGRVIARVDTLGNTTTTEYSPDGRTVFVRNPNTSTRVTTRSASGDTLSITGSAVTPEFHTYGISPDGTRWSRTVRGETANSPRFSKSYKNLLGQTIREERSGFRGAILATVNAYDSFGRLVSTSADYEPTVEYTYDTLGNRIATTRRVDAAATGTTSILLVDAEWRKTETLSSFIIDDNIVWLIQTNIVSCSDSAIAPLVTSSAQQLTGLSAALPARSRSFDVRGNVTVNEMLVAASIVTSRQTVPYATNKPLAISRYGVSLKEVSVSAVTNTVAYDALGRQIAHTDGRGNTRHTEYNSLGQRSVSIDALGNPTTYAYDQFGNLASVTDPLGNATVYEYDLRGRTTYEGGATYPVRYTYDVFGNKTTMMTYRNESLGLDSGDVTTWHYDIASGVMTNKVYADCKGPTYTYTPDGKLSRRIWARGIVTDYSYDNWGNLTNTAYSDNTPTVSLSYDAFGRQIEAHDAAGVTTFLYDSFGSLTNETAIGVAGTNTIVRHWDNFGRSLGYSLAGRVVPDEPIRQSIYTYDPATGRLATMYVNGSDTPFAWNYLPGSDLKSLLMYPNGLISSWTYDANNLLLQVRNATSTNVISQYEYAYDPVGRCINMSKSGTVFAQNDTISYGYNEKSELTNAVASVDFAYQYAYDYDEIGNRKVSIERGTNTFYSSNSLNQYTLIDDFSPLYDEDGNQTLVKTATGIWQVQYNGENRPVRWERVTANSPASKPSALMLISMSFDRMGRRVMKNDLSFFYDGYLQIANINSVSVGSQLAPTNSQLFVWDPTESIATRPLLWFNLNVATYYIHDANKNVSGVIASSGEVLTHYEYAPYGKAVGHILNNHDDNTLRYASEFSERDLGVVYFNYRHYDSHGGRWIGMDPIGERGGIGLYCFLNNNPISRNDYLGMSWGSSITGAVYYYDNYGPGHVSSCPCGRDLVYVSNPPKEDDDKALRWARENLYVGGQKPYDANYPDWFAPNSHLQKCECVCSLLIVAHGGGSRDRVGLHWGKVWIHESESGDKENNEEANEISRIFNKDKIRFCKGCKIELRVCNLGLFASLKKRIEENSGCSVVVYDQVVSPSLTPVGK